MTFTGPFLGVIPEELKLVRTIEMQILFHFNKLKHFDIHSITTPGCVTISNFDFLKLINKIL